HAGMITVDSSDVSIDNFALDHQNQLVNIYGNISGNPDKKLMLECKNINLGHLSSMVHAQKWKPEGILNGKAEFSNLYGNLFFHATLNVDSLCINYQKFGTSIVNANFDNADKNIFIDANAHRGSVDILSVKGLYSVQSKTIDFNINLYKLMINLFEPFVASVFSGIHGEASGKVRLSGPLKSPVLNGSLRINNASFV